MMQRIRGFNWGNTPLGEFDTWSPTLRCAVSLMLDLPHPACVVWGNDLHSVYNDGFAALLGHSHAQGLGQPCRELFGARWSALAPVFDEMLKGNRQNACVNPLTGIADGSETGLSFSWVPLRDEVAQPQIKGLFCVAIRLPGPDGAGRPLPDILDGSFLGLAERLARAGIWEWDIQAGRVYWSPAFFALFGLDPAVHSASVECWKSILHPEDRDHAVLRLEAAVRDRTPLFNPYRIRLPGGGVRWIEAYGDTMCNEAGQPVRMAGLCIDITERERLASENVELQRLLVDHRALEQELLESRERLEMALTGSRQVLWDYDVSRGQIACDWRWGPILGYPPRQRIHDLAAWQAIVHPDDLALVLSAMEAHVEGDTESLYSEYRLRHKDGHWVWVVVRGKVVARDAHGVPIRLAGTITDISQQKRLTQEGSELLARLVALLREASNPEVQLTSPAPDQNALNGLTRRQRQIMESIAKGMTSGQIATQLKIATATVITHRRELMRRLKLHSAADVVRFALRNGIGCD